MKAVAIVAHPDDETIWSGGLIMRHADWDWTVLSLCRRDDHDRAPKFEFVCDYLAVNGLISDLDDGNPLKPINPRREIGRRIMDCLPTMHWDLCVTHGGNGEYGHQRHKEIHAEVLSLVQDGILHCKDLWTFSYDCDVAKKACYVGRDAQEFVHLKQGEVEEKIRLIHNLYGYPMDSFEVQVCPEIESFRNWSGALQEWAA